MTDDNRSKNLAQELERAAGAFQAAEALLALGLTADTISRAYHAAFHVARAWLLSRGLEAKTHAGVVHLLNTEFIRAGLLPSSFNRLFAGLQRTREYADDDSDDDARAEIEAARSREAAATALLRGEGWLET